MGIFIIRNRNVLGILSVGTPLTLCLNALTIFIFLIYHIVWVPYPLCKRKSRWCCQLTSFILHSVRILIRTKLNYLLNHLFFSIWLSGNTASKFISVTHSFKYLLLLLYELSACDVIRHNTL